MRSAIIGLASLCFLSACGTQTVTLQPVKIDPAMIEIQGRIALTAVEQAIAAYTAVTPLGAEDQNNVNMAEEVATQLLKNFQASQPTNLPTMASSTMQAINTIIAVLPSAALPPEARAAIAAFEVLAQNLPDLIAAQQAQMAAQQPQPVPPPTVPAPAAQPAPVSPPPK